MLLISRMPSGQRLPICLVTHCRRITAQGRPAAAPPPPAVDRSQPPLPPTPTPHPPSSPLFAVFTNRVEDMRLQDLAEMDAREQVQQVQEYFGDYVALEAHHFLVPLARPHLALQPFAWDFGNSSDAVARMTEGVASLLLSLRRRFLIRYQRGSEMGERFAQSLHHLTAVEERELFDFGSRDRDRGGGGSSSSSGGGEGPPVLLVLDRRDDPVTPLLSQWTYQVGGRCGGRGGRGVCGGLGASLEKQTRSLLSG